MSPAPCGADLTAAYEALRAQATGQGSHTTPRGLALLLRSGVPDWMRAWSSLASSSPPRPAPPPVRSVSLSSGAELVRLLADMALAGLQGSRA